MILDKDWLLEEAQEAFLLGSKNPGECLCCKRHVDYIFMTPSQTLYSDPESNKDISLCFDCSKEYTEQMNYQWQEYYGSIL